MSLKDRLNSCNDIFNKIGDEIILINHQGRIIYANESAVQGLGYPRKTLLSKRIMDFYKQKLSLKIWKTKYFQELKRSGRPISYQIERVVRNGKTRTLEATAVYVCYGTQEFILSIGRDVTEKLEFTRNRQDYEKMIALSLFVSGTAQEIKYPLEAILSHIQTMLKKYGQCDFEYIGYKEFKNIIKTMTDISNQIRHCCDITGKLLTLNRKRAGTKEGSCNANDCIQENLRILSQQLNYTSVKVQLKCSRNLPPVAISESDLNQVIRHLVSNAIYAMPSGGRLTIKSFLRRKEGKAQLEFKDEGIGIPKENLPHVFEAFFTTRQRGIGQSAGLGLSVVHSIIKAAKGDVSIQSNLRQGTLIKVILPVKSK
ncbi:MAG: ATP-binding protein [Candidatus Omnitrophota bacterium]